jgi:hypothetical protein
MATDYETFVRRKSQIDTDVVSHEQRRPTAHGAIP